jgi:hypothetical protein
MCVWPYVCECAVFLSVIMCPIGVQSLAVVTE